MKRYQVVPQDGRYTLVDVRTGASWKGLSSDVAESMAAALERAFGVRT